MNRKTCLLVSDPASCHSALQSVNGLLDEQDKLLLGVGDGTVRLKPESVYLPFKLYDLSWGLLKDLGIQEHLGRATHRKKKSIQQLLKSTLFLDMLLFDPTTIRHILSDEHLTKALSQVKCPIMIIDVEGPEMEEVFLFYDGTSRSFKAIQRFCYLFRSQLEQAEVKLIVHIGEEALHHEECVYDYIRGFKRNFSIIRLFGDEYESELTDMIHSAKHIGLVADGTRERALDQFRNFSETVQNRVKMFIY